MAMICACPRESKAPGIQARAKAFLEELLCESAATVWYNIARRTKMNAEEGEMTETGGG